MAPRPAFLSGLGGGRTTPTGLLPPSQRDKPQPRRDFSDVSGFTNIGTDRSKPEFLTPAKNIMPVVPQSRDMGALNEAIFRNRNTGVMNMLNRDMPRSAPDMAGGNIAQQVLGDAYNKAVGLGYQPSELIDMVNTAQSFGRGIDVDKFKTSLDRFQGFQDADGGIFKFEEPQEDGSTITKQYLSVSRPELTANAPTLAQLLEDISGGISNMVGAGADFVMGGGATGRILEGIKNQFNQGRDFVGQFTNPGNLSQRLDAAGPEAKRIYALKLSQGVPFQQAFEEATGQKFATGGIATLQ